MVDEIKQKIEELLKLGKDRSEMNLWLNLLTTMTDEELKELALNLDKELELIRHK